MIGRIEIQLRIKAEIWNERSRSVTPCLCELVISKLGHAVTISFCCYIMHVFLFIVTKHSSLSAKQFLGPRCNLMDSKIIHVCSLKVVHLRMFMYFS
jgi:hypothetical protein